MAGKIVLAIKIAPNGDVTDVSKAGGSGLSSDVEQCIIKRAKSGTFDAPGGSGFDHAGPGHVREASRLIRHRLECR